MCEEEVLDVAADLLLRAEGVITTDFTEERTYYIDDNWRKGVEEQERQSDLLAENLSSMTWCMCTGFELAGYLFLNIAFSEDGAQEYGIVKIVDGQRNAEGDGVIKGIKIESYTFMWGSLGEAKKFIQSVIQGKCDGVLSKDVTITAEAKGHSCGYCQ